MSDEKKRTRRTWTPEDDAALTTAVEAVLPLAFRTRDLWWAAVCGRMGLPDVTPDSARSRWKRLQEAEAQARVAREEQQERERIEQELRAKDDVWAQISDRIEAQERDLAESTYDEVIALRTRLERIEGLVQGLVERIEGLVQGLVEVWK